MVESVSEDDSAFSRDDGLSSDTSSGPVRDEPFDLVCESDLVDSGVPHTRQTHFDHTEESMPSWLQEVSRFATIHFDGEQKFVY